MEVVDLIRTQLSGPVIERLGAAAGLDPSKSRDVAKLLVPVQLQALADKARAPGGAPQLTGMLAQLGPVDDVPTLVEHPEATQELASVGESLVAQLFGGQASAVAEEAARETAAPLSGVVKFMQTLLPLVIGLLARHLNDRGLGLNTAGSVLAGIAGTDQVRGLFTAPEPDAEPAAGAPVNATGQAPVAEPSPTPVSPAAAPPEETPAPVQETAPATPAETIRRAFSGRNAERLGTAAGIRSSDAGRATTTVVPVLMAAMARRAQTPGGGKHLLGIAEKNAALADPEVALADTPRLEMTGQSLLNDLLAGGLGRTVGQLGSAVGAPGANVQRLLAIVAPMLLGLFGRNASDWRLNADGFASFLTGVSGDLKAMLPAGMASLVGLLETTPPPSEAPAAVPPVVSPSQPAVGRTPPPTVPSPAPTVRLDTAPAVENPPARVQSTSATEPEPRRAFPWWIVLIVLLLVALAVWYFFLRGNPTPTSLGEARDLFEHAIAASLRQDTWIGG